MRRKLNLPSRFNAQSWGRQKRLEFIDFHLFWENEITKPQVQRFFEAAENTIKEDFVCYTSDLKGRMKLDDKRKRYVADADFQPLIVEPDATDYLYFLARGADALDLVLNHADRVGSDDFFYFPPQIARRRQINAECLRNVLQAIRHNLRTTLIRPRKVAGAPPEMAKNREVLITYESPNKTKSESFWISPHALLHDGFRWACRAYRYDYNRFGDLVLDRIVKVGKARAATDHGRMEDEEWSREFPVEIGPNPGLDISVRAHIEKQYGMKGGKITVPVKECAIVYFLKRYQVEEKSAKKAPHQEPIIVLNRDEVTARIPPRMRIPPEVD